MSYKTYSFSRWSDNKKMTKDFWNLANSIYSLDPNWIPPIISEAKRILDRDRNPYFLNSILQFFICYQNGLPVSRAAVIIKSTHLFKFGTKTAFFGFFETRNDLNAVASLFSNIEAYCRSFGIECLEGPFNPNHYSELGMQTNQFGTEPAFFQAYNPEYYPTLVQKHGFEEVVRLHTRKNGNIKDFISRRYKNRNNIISKTQYSIRSLNKWDLKNELEHMRKVNNNAFAGNWHFLPLSREEYLFSAKYLSMVTEPDLVKIVEYQNKPVGILHCVLDVNPLLKNMKGKVGPIKYLQFKNRKKKLKNLIIFTIAIKKEHQKTCVLKLMINSFIEIGIKYRVLETTWMSKSNMDAVRIAEYFGLMPDKQFVIYKKSVK